MANIYWKTTACLSTVSTPKIHEVPRMGSSTATAFTVSLQGVGPVGKDAPGSLRLSQDTGPAGTGSGLDLGVCGPVKLCPARARVGTYLKTLGFPCSL